MTSTIDKPRPLSRYVRGIAHLSLSSGAQVEIPMSRATAEHLRQKAAGAEGSDDLDWHDIGFIQFGPLELIRFEPLPELGWPLTASERQKQSENGYRAGVVNALIELHQDLGGGEPSYSARAMWCLHHMLTEGIEPKKLADIAKTVEGTRGARVVAAAYRSAAADTVDDQPAKEQPVPDPSCGGVQDAHDAPLVGEGEASPDVTSSAPNVPDDHQGPTTGPDAETSDPSDGRK